jgi:hypothetical protein
MKLVQMKFTLERVEKSFFGKSNPSVPHSTMRCSGRALTISVSHELVLIQIIPGVTEDADPSTTLHEDVKVINKLIDGIIGDKKSDGTLLEQAFDSHDDSWTRVDLKGCPLSAKNVVKFKLGECKESGRRSNTKTRHNGSRKPSRTARDRSGNAAHKELSTPSNRLEISTSDNYYTKQMQLTKYGESHETENCESTIVKCCQCNVNHSLSHHLSE